MTTYEQIYLDTLAGVKNALRDHVPVEAFATLEALPMTAVLAVLYERGKVYEPEILSADPEQLLALRDRFPELAAQLPDLPADQQQMCANVLRFMYRLACEFINNE